MATPDCRHCIDVLVDYLEGQLPPEKEKALDQHFLGCPPCLEFMDQYRASSSLCRKALETEMPDALAQMLGDFLGKNCK